MDRNKLWEYVWSANTLTKIAEAEEWLRENVDDIELFNDLMLQLAWQYRDCVGAKQFG